MKQTAIKLGKQAAVTALGVLVAIALVNKVKPVQKFTGRV